MAAQYSGINEGNHKYGNNLMRLKRIIIWVIFICIEVAFIIFILKGWLAVEERAPGLFGIHGLPRILSTVFTLFFFIIFTLLGASYLIEFGVDKNQNITRESDKQNNNNL